MYLSASVLFSKCSLVKEVVHKNFGNILGRICMAFLLSSQIDDEIDDE